MTEWIKCQDKTPENSGRYLVFKQKGEHRHQTAAYKYPHPCCKVNVAYYEKHFNKWEWNSFENEIIEPTHWMPLPEIPND